MCAINGFTFEDTDLVTRMNKATAHRGPDGTGTFCGHGVSLGHNRLSIIDLSPSAAQPMWNKDNTVVISYNGEIFNFKELRKELVGYPFKSNSDTEVILAAYETWGKDAFKRFNGMFAFALFDVRTKELMLVRDPSGIKPLFYAWNGKKLVFSSDIRGVLVHSDVPRNLHYEALAHYLRVLYVPAPHTMFADIKKLEPGHVLTHAQGVITIRPFSGMDAEAGAEVTDTMLHDTLQSAVSRQLVSDRSIGVYLSGGVDSSIILACASKVHPSINTFSVGFDLGEHHPRKDVFNADFELARRTAKHFGSTHHEFLFRSEDAVDIFHDAIEHLGEPIANATSLPMLYLARAVKKHATVVLCGDGGDELFGGYERYRLSLLSSHFRTLPHPARRALASFFPAFRKLDTPPGIERFARFMFQKDAEVERIVQEHVPLDATRLFFEERFFSKTQGDFEKQFMDTDRASWLVDESLAKTDKMSMASGVEARVPFLDNEVIALARRMRRSQKVTLFETKRMLKRAFRDELPPHLFGQPKRGWFSPGGEWVKQGAFKRFTDEVLSSSYCSESSGLFRFDEIAAMLETHRAQTEYHMPTLWALLTFQVWMRTFNVRS